MFLHSLFWVSRQHLHATEKHINFQSDQIKSSS